MKSVVYVIEDDCGVCDALQWLFKSVAIPVEIYRNASSFLQAYDINWHGCLLIDIRLPDMSGLDLQDQLKALNNKLPIIFITGHGDIPMAVRAMKNGAFNFLTKPFNNQNLLEEVQRAIIKNQSNAETTVFNPINELTPREQQILMLIVDGKLNKEIAHELDIAMSTVELHRANIMQKMGAKNIVDLIKKYMSISSS